MGRLDDRVRWYLMWREASEEVRRAYRRLARDHHPDANPGAEERFKETPEEEAGVRREVLLELRPVASRDGWNGEAHRPG